MVVCVVGIAQPVTQRSTSPVTVQDARLFAQFNFRPPAFRDTIEANQNIGLDSCGALIFSRDINAYYYRACSPKRWVAVTGGQVGNAWLLGGNTSPTSTYLGTLDNKEITFGTNGIARMRVAGTGINRSTTARQKYLSIDTASRYLYYTDGTDTTSLSNRINQNIDSLKRNPGTDSVFARKNGQWNFQYKDSTGGGTQDLQSVLNAGNLSYQKSILIIDSVNTGSSANTLAILSSSDSIRGTTSPNFVGLEKRFTFNYATLQFDKTTYPGKLLSVMYLSSSDIGKEFRARSDKMFFKNLSNSKTFYIAPPNTITNDTIYFPNSTGTLVSKINGISPDSTGNITLSAGSGTVTSVATGYGLSGGTITTSGTLIADTSISGLSGKYLRIVDTTNRWLSSVSQPTDSSLTFVKDGTTTTYTIRSAVATSATRLVTAVYNNTGSTIAKGSVVYISGAHSSILPTIALAQANQESTSAFTYGLVENDIPTSNSGVVIQSGTITNLNLPTSSYTDGQTLYLSPTVAGGYTTTKPTAPNHYVAIGTITRAHPVFGTLQVAIRNGFQLDEMSDVQIPAVPADSTLLQFSRVDSLWHAVTVANAIGANYIKPSDTASMLSNYVRNVPTIAYLGSDFTTTSTTAVSTNLSIAVAANTAYRIMISGSASKATSSTGMKISISAPTGTTIKATASLGSNAISTIVNSFITAINTLGSTFATGVGVEVPFRVEGILVTGSTAGNIVLQGATVTSNTATIYANTLMTLTKAYSQ